MNGDTKPTWSVLNSWLYDGSRSSKIPKQVIEDSQVGPQYILYYFKNSIYNVWFNEHFNNYGIYKLDKQEVLKFLKQCVLDTGYKPKFIPRFTSEKSKISKKLKKTYPFLKWDDIKLFVQLIDKSEDKNRVYETLGIYSAKKTKTTKKDKEKIKEIQENNKGTLINSFLEGFETVKL